MKEKKIYAVLAGALFIISSFFHIGYFAMNDWFRLIHVIDWIGILIFVVIGITLLVGRINVGTVIACAVNVIVNIVSLIKWVSFSDILYLVTNILILISCIMVISKNIKTAKILSFIQIGLYVISVFIGGFGINLWLIRIVLIIASYVLLALNINSIPCVETKIQKSAIANDLNSAKIGTADKLFQYKELLDSGIISQEEFEEKKKQVLEL